MTAVSRSTCDERPHRQSIHSFSPLLEKKCERGTEEREERAQTITQRERRTREELSVGNNS